MTSTHIGQIAPTLVARNQHGAGGKRGATGSGTSLQNSNEIAGWLSQHSPADMDKAAVSRALSHNVELAIRLEGRYPTGPNGEHLPSYTVAVGCDIRGSTQDRERAKADLVKFQTPAPVRAIEDWLAELSVITASRSREHVEAALMVNAYASRLATYPADVVRYALLSKTWKWWPTWDELEKVCEAKAGPRRHMIAALSTPEPDPEPARRPPTQEERDRVQAMVDEMFPDKPQDQRKAAVDIALRGNCMAAE